jgi:UDP-N-acetylglucosamine 2-epimerase
MKICSIVGARPEFIQEKPVHQALIANHQEILIHTGQHYDDQMSETFFRELQLPQPEHHLGVGSGTHAEQTAKILLALEPLLIQEQPDLVIVRGDTNSTLAGALVASKLNLKLVHIEAGERSFNRQMPEEINRLVVDRLADIHFCASQKAVHHLSEEGTSGAVYWVGDVMLDALLEMLPLARINSTILSRLGLQPKGYSLVTLHRAATVDDPTQLRRIMSGLNNIKERIIFPVHPRTRSALIQNQIQLADHIQAIDPVGFLDMLIFEENARMIATDSGGVQREAYNLRIPCLTLREETEWMETVDSGWNHLVGTDPVELSRSWFDFAPLENHPALFGNGHAAKQIVQILEGKSSPQEWNNPKTELTPA